MVTQPILIKEATVEEVPFLKAMIWEAILASPIFVAHHGVEILQQPHPKMLRLHRFKCKG
jgi:hypothetical protein